MRAPMITDEEAWVNWGMRPPGRKEVQIARPIRVGGIPYNVGDVVTVKDNDALYLISSGKATSYPPPLPKEEESAEVTAKRRKEALNSGPYRVEITRPCLVQGRYCEPGEVISVTEEDAGCLAVSSRGKIVDSPPKEETIEEMVRRMIEEQLQGRTV